MKSNYFFSLEALKGQKSFEGGSLIAATGKEVPGFVNISFACLKLNKNGHLAPIWHPNANKMGYCEEGKVLVTIRGPNGIEMFTVEKGELFFIPKGFIHHITNVGQRQAVIDFALSHPEPQTMTLTNALGCLTDDVFTATFNTPEHFVDGLKKGKKTDLIQTLKYDTEAPPFISDRYKFNIAASSRAILTPGGYLQIGTTANMPVLEDLAVLGFGLNAKGCVEPHWHTNAGELVYIVKGKTRITILAPDGNVESLEVNAGQGAFAPASYFHNIVNVGNEEVEVIAFFSNANPDYIGIAEAAGTCSNELLASLFNIDKNYFENFNNKGQPLVIVPV